MKCLLEAECRGNELMIQRGGDVEHEGKGIFLRLVVKNPVLQNPWADGFI
jgi:hypothetical protein